MTRSNKKRSRKAVSLLVTVSMLLTLMPIASFAEDTPPPIFSDVANDAWYKEAVDYATTNGLLVGVADDQFGPEQNVTRGMVVTVMWRQSGSPQNDGQSSFTDVPSDQWYAQAVSWGAEQGMVGGYDAKTFGPNDPVTREQLVAFMQRFAEKNDENVATSDDAILDKFSDANTVSDWAKNAVIWGLENKIIGGMTDTLLAPQNSATRAQYATILMRTGATISDEIDLSNYDKVTYYHNGDIITVDETVGENDDGTPIYAKAVLAGDGYIIAVAYSDEDVAKLEKLLANADYEDVDLKGETMIPAFVDAHSHIDSVGRYVSASPSAGVTSLENLVAIGKKDFDAWVNDHTYDSVYGPIEPGGKNWFITSGYDNTAFVDGWEEMGLAPYAMPTKEVLDMISTDYPIMYSHASGHLSVVNSLGMELLEKAVKEKGLEDYANPEVNWPKDENGEYTGLLNENGSFVISQLGFNSTESTRTASPSTVLENAMDVYASYGIASGIIGGGGGDKTALMEGIPEDERIIDITSLVGYDQRTEVLNGTTTANSTYNGDYNLKYGAVKMFLDGSPQGKTAWFAVDENDPSGGGYYRDANETLLTNEDASNAWWWGEAEGKIIDSEVLTERFTNLMKEGVQFHCHANGTGAIQQFIDCYRNALIANGVDLNDKDAIKAMQDKIRPVIIHSQTITDKQLKECKDLGLNISYFTDHVFYYGDYHLYSTLGPDRGQRISPMRDTLADDMGINVTMHQDSPVAPPKMLFSVYNAATRITRDGQAIGRGSADGSSDNDKRITDWSNKAYDTRDERVSAYEALKCVTINSAWQNFDEDIKGSISVGKQADFAILNVNPLTQEFLGLTPQEVQNGQFVEQTINNDTVIFEK